DPNKKQKVTCWKCGKSGHLKKDCKGGKVGNKANGSGINGSSNSLKDRCWFKTYESLNDGSILHMGNESTALVHRLGCVDLKFSSGKLNIVNDNIGSAFMPTSKLNDSILWHARLGHVHFKRMQDMSNDRLILTFDMDTEKFCWYYHEMTALYTPQQNGISKRKNRVLKEMVNSMLSYLGLGQGFWGEAMLTACYLLNRVPNKKNKITPYELWTKRKPNLNYLRVWGCRAVVSLPDPKLKTFGEKGIECIFVGYVKHSKAFRFYVIEPNDSVIINSIIKSRDVIFDKNRFSSVPRPSQRSQVNRTEDFGGSVVLENVTEEDDPETFDEAMKSLDVAFWKEAINDEMDSIMGNNTWVLADLPIGCKPLGCKWIFKRKLKVDGTIEKSKARLVIQGFKQKLWIDYFDTYAPVARISTIRLLIVMASIHNLIIHQMDVKITFLNGELDEEVYMNQPQGFIMPGNENKVCKLIKSLYGLKQASKQWHQKFNEVVLSNVYLLNQANKCVYSKFDESGKGVIICLYVADMLIFGTDQVQVYQTKEFLSSRFSMKDMGEADVILGIRIKHESNGISISRSYYIKKVLKKFNYFDCTPVSTPMDTSEKLMPNDGQAVSQLEYSRMIGCLMYAMTCTRPDIAFVVGKLSRHTSNPGTQHWQAIQRVLKYLKKPMDYRLLYTGYPSVLEGYTDASWISNTEDNSSTSGWVFLLGGGAISWAFNHF
ncbi:zinc finger, CCHC-type containing protein, partial [Tanacetum coccineum]